MASPAIIYRGGELDSVTVISGSAVATTSGYHISSYSAMAINIAGNVLGEMFRNSDGSTTDVSGGDVLWGMFYWSTAGATYTATLCTIYDTSGRAALRVQLTTGATYNFQHNTSSTGTPAWTTLSTFAGSVDAYLVFSVKTGSSKEYSFFVNGDQVGGGVFDNPNISGLSRFTIGSLPSGANGISQIQFSRGIQLVGARVMTRKADGAGDYSQMAGVYTNLVKTGINDATAIISNTTGQKSTFSYQNVIVPEGLEMQNEVWTWNRVKNDGSAPESIKQIAIIDSVEQESPPLPVSPGFQQLPSVFGGLTPAKWDAIQIGMESVDV